MNEYDYERISALRKRGYELTRSSDETDRQSGFDINYLIGKLDESDKVIDQLRTLIKNRIQQLKEIGKVVQELREQRTIMLQVLEELETMLDKQESSSTRTYELARALEIVRDTVAKVNERSAV